MKKTILISLLILSVSQIYGVINNYAKWTKTELILCNGVVRRTIQLPSLKGNFLSVSYKPMTGNYDAVSDTCTDFQFEVDDTIYSGRGQWKLVNIRVDH